MLYQSPTEITLARQIRITSADASNIIELVDGADALKTAAPPYAINIQGGLELVTLQANFYLASGLRKNPYPNINELAPDIVQNVSIIEHKEKYNPSTGHAIELSFFEDIYSGVINWIPKSRDYLYSVGEIEQYLPLLNPYFSADETPYYLGTNKIGIGVTAGILGPDDYINIHASIKGTLSCWFLPYYPNLQSQTFSGTANTTPVEILQASTVFTKRVYLMISNKGPGKLFLFSPNGPWLEPNTSLVWEGAGFDTSYTGLHGNTNLFRMGGLIPDVAIRVSSDSYADYAVFNYYLG